MNRLKFCLLVIALAFSPSASHAFLVNYEFEGLVTGSGVTWTSAGDKIKGKIGFNPAGAVPRDVAEAPGEFDFTPGNLEIVIKIGPYSGVIHNFGVNGPTFRPGSMILHDGLFEPESGWDRIFLEAYGENVFDSQPTTSLAGGRWERYDGEGTNWQLDDQRQGFLSGASGIITKFRFLDSSPTPEPSSAALLASALGLFGGYRFQRRKSKKGVRS